MFDGFSPSDDVAQSARDGSDDRCGRERCNVGWKRTQYLRVNLSIGSTWIAWTQRERKRTPLHPPFIIIQVAPTTPTFISTM